MALIINLKAYLLKKLTNKKLVDFDLKDTKNVLVLRYDRIGDMILTTPVFRELKKTYPNISISVLASKDNKDVISSFVGLKHNDLKLGASETNSFEDVNFMIDFKKSF